MQVNVAGVRRNLKNIAHNYTDAQVKVREATSNDPWGPSCTLMSEIADLTYNVMAFTEIMQMIWKRLNDHGKNWRHVYKALTLLEYLIKTGSEKVAQQCKENLFAIQTLKDFQYYEEGKDHGLNVREKAKHLAALLKDDETLKNERARALKAKERLAQNTSGFGSDGTVDTITLSAPTSPTGRVGTWGVGGSRLHHSGELGGATSASSALATSREIENARPQTVGEEELQLQLALAMSREEAELEEQRRKSDDVRLQLALSESQNELKLASPPGTSQKQSHMLDLLDVNLSTPAGNPTSAASASAPEKDPWGMPPQPPSVDPWGVAIPASAPPDPWSPIPAASTTTVSTKPQTASASANDPWQPIGMQQRDPWSPADQSPSVPVQSPLSHSSNDIDDFDVITNRERINNNGQKSPNTFDLNALGDQLLADSGRNNKKSAQEFLGENSGLVNLDNLVTPLNKPNNTSLLGSMANPFAGGQPPQNLFQQPVPPRPSMNQIRQAPLFGDNNNSLPSPLTPSPNPFLS